MIWQNRKWRMLMEGKLSFTKERTTFQIMTGYNQDVSRS